MSKYLLPMKIDADKSVIGSFKEIFAILDDPQNVKNDISTFAGRMTQFAGLLGKRGTLAGVDEIELGTDADEAASLFKVVIEKLIDKDMKIIITTHHKGWLHCLQPMITLNFSQPFMMRRTNVRRMGFCKGRLERVMHLRQLFDMEFLQH